MNRKNLITVPTFPKKNEQGPVPPEDPVLRPYHQWLAAREAGDESEAGVTLESVAFWEVTALTPTSLAGIAALADVLWSLWGDDDLIDPTSRMVAAIWRGASGKDGTPDRPIVP